MTEAEAKQFAIDAHGDQKYGDQPYVVHLYAVRQVLTDAGFLGGPIAQAAWLHDTLEDTSVFPEQIEALFGAEVRALVWAVTGVGSNRRERNKSIYAKASLSPWAVTLKLADRIANTEDAQLRNPRLHAMYRAEAMEFAMALQKYGPAEMWARLERAYETVTVSERRAAILRWLEEQEALCEAATPGPWKLWGMTVMDDPTGTSNHAQCREIADTFDPDRGLRTWNADFIAASRTALPLALEAIRAEVEAHPAAANGNWCNGEPCMALGVHADECPSIERLFSALGLAVPVSA